MFFLLAVPPKLDRNRLKDLTVSVGEMMKFESNVIGEPEAEVTWKKEGRVLESNRELSITNVPYNTKLIIKSAKRSDEGQYTVTAVNSEGRDQVIVNLTVLDKPGKPEGPLKADNVTANGCRLKWRNRRRSTQSTYMMKEDEILNIFDQVDLKYGNDPKNYWIVVKRY